MCPIRPEIIQATEDNLPNAFLRPQWPKDITRQCPHCHAELHPQINLSFGLGKLGRSFKLIGYWITMPWALVMMMLGATAGRWGGFVVGIGIIVPGVFFAVLAAMSPRTRRVRCYPCKYSKDYPAMPKTGIHSP